MKIPNQQQLDKIRARSNTATPGPWMWHLNDSQKDVKLVTTHSGQYFVMGMTRWGMHGAAPTFQIYDKYEGPVSERKGKGMRRVELLSKSLPGKEHHKGWDDYIDHPDAIFIEKSKEDVEALLTYIDDVTHGEKFNALALAAAKVAHNLYMPNNASFEFNIIQYPVDRMIYDSIRVAMSEVLKDDD